MVASCVPSSSNALHITCQAWPLLVTCIGRSKPRPAYCADKQEQCNEPNREQWPKEEHDQCSTKRPTPEQGDTRCWAAGLVMRHPIAPEKPSDKLTACRHESEP